MDKRATKILALMAANGGSVTTLQVSQRLKISFRLAFRLLASLREGGIITAIKTAPLYQEILWSIKN